MGIRGFEAAAGRWHGFVPCRTGGAPARGARAGAEKAGRGRERPLHRQVIGTGGRPDFGAPGRRGLNI
ncbi:hypothetical protein J2850_001437 [Azospirillum picis]|uniref:Uncharacterized protein n=1 Tax=Azospirillum picis TaxID=488438 RepID=A0ABU0MFI1_9PROT|nr:hypothetical protein [Azospirillum picis]MDQ0532197.1 hypothetical protein [Azospirillum picis]